MYISTYITKSFDCRPKHFMDNLQTYTAVLNIQGLVFEKFTAFWKTT